MTDEAHLDDDALSAVLDGEARPEDDVHVDTCPSCRARLQVLRDASLLVRTPVPAVSDDERDAAIAAAMSSSGADIVPLKQRSQRSAAPRWLAAAALLVAVAVGAVLLRGGSGDDDSSSSGMALSTTVVPGASGGATAAGSAAGAPVDGGDLGAIDVRQLRSRIDAALSGQQQERTAADSASPEAAVGTTSKARDCETNVRAGNPDLGPLVYRASGTFDDEPVTVLAFDTSGRRWVYVVDGACAIRNQTTYSV